MKKTLFNLELATVITGVVAFSCSEEIDESNLYTFTGQTIADYISEEEHLSLFNEIISCVGYDKLMSSYGNYTCFAPSNEGILEYVDSLYNDTISAIPHNGMEAPGMLGIIGGMDDNGNIIPPNDSLCLDITLFHLLYSDVLSIDLNQGNTLNTMLNREISTSIDGDGEILINGYSKMTKFDVELENGLLHEVDHVFRRSNALITNEVGNHAGFSLFSEAMNKCGFQDILTKQKRTNFTIPKKEEQEYIPTECRMGYTVFAETDDAFRRAGITTFEQLLDSCRKWYANCHEWYDYYRTNNIEVSTGEDYGNPNNVLNMFVRYHIVEMKVPYDRLFNAKGAVPEAVVREYYETMLPYTLLKVTRVNNLPRLNQNVENSTLSDEPLINNTAICKVRHNGMLVQTGGFSCVNGYIHPINGVLKYDAKVPREVLNERMRFDITSLLPEMLDNNVRRATRSELRGMNGGIACTNSSYGGQSTVQFPRNYFEHLMVYNGNESDIFYLSAQEDGWANYQGDEFLIEGAYDFALRLPPVPEGLYELRLGYSANYKRGMMQMYIGRNTQLAQMMPVDIPLDMRKYSEAGTTPANPHAFTGWCDWKLCADDGAETDINMRYLGFMRGPYGFTKTNSDTPGTVNLRDDNMALRRILMKEQFQQGEYWMRFKTMLPENKDSQFHLDYIEFVPEAVYNNSKYPEDMY